MKDDAPKACLTDHHITIKCKGTLHASNVMGCLDARWTWILCYGYFVVLLCQKLIKWTHFYKYRVTWIRVVRTSVMCLFLLGPLLRNAGIPGLTITYFIILALLTIVALDQIEIQLVHRRMDSD